MGKTDAPPAESAYRRLVQWVPDHVSSCLALLGGFTARRPNVVICIALLLVMIGAPGWVRFKMVTDPQKLWAPQNSPEAQRQKFVQDTFGTKDAFYQVYFTATGDAADSQHGALTVDAVRDVFQFGNSLKTMNVEGVGTWSDVCKMLFTGLCMESGITRFWSWDSDTFELSVEGNQTKLLSDVSKGRYFDGGQVILLDAFLDTTKTLDGTIVSAQTLVLSFVLDSDLSKDEMASWLTAADHLVVSFVPQTTGLSVASFHLDSLQNEVLAAAQGDIPLVGGAVAVLIIICCIMMFCKDPVESRMSLALVGVLCVILATGMGFGFCMAIGIPFTPLQQLLPFILLGIGVDDMFILIRGLDEAKVELPSGSMEEHFRRTLETSGVSITLTSLTNLVAFLLGSLSALPAVRYFCIYAGIAIISDYILQVTLFLGAMVLTERRMRAGRMDLLPWKQAANPKQLGQSGVIAGSEKKPDAVSQLIDGYIAPFILHPCVQVFLILGFMGLAFAGVWGGLHGQIGQKFSDLVRKGSKAGEFLNQFEAITEKQSAGPVDIYFSHVDSSQPHTQRRILQSWEYAKQNSQFLSGPDSPQHCWLTKLLEFAKKQEMHEGEIMTDDGFLKQDQFDAILQKMLQRFQYKIWGEDVVFDDNGVVISSRCPLLHGPVANTGSRVDILNGVNQVIDHANKDIFEEEGVVLLYTLHHVFFASDAILMQELFVNVSLAVVGIVVVNMIMLTSPLAVLVMVTAVLLVELGLLAVMWVAGIELSSLTLLLIIMALGLGIDYPVHVLHRSLTIDGGSAKEQAHKALVSVGPAVGVGFITTASGIMLLAGTQSMLFNTVFIMLISTVCLAFAAGILYVPVVMVVTRLPLAMDSASTIPVFMGKDVTGGV